VVGRTVDEESTTETGVLGANVWTASAGAVGAAWPSAPVGDWDALSVGVTVEVVSGLEMLGEGVATSVVVVGVVG
jgi:hypothetical protein